MSDSEVETKKEFQTLSQEDPFDKAHYYITKLQSVLENEELRVRQEREAFESVAKKLKQVQFSSTVNLNVGGQIFTTSLQTLTKDAGSMLHGMFSGRFDTKPLKDGNYFIDRDGTCFRYILNYLRTGKLNLPADEVIRKDVLEEAEFYQIQGIIDKLKPKPYSESVILSPQHRDWLMEAVGKSYDRFKLLYRASRNGWSSTNFHTCCDGKGPTLVVIKSGNYIFGGFTNLSWDGSGAYKSDDAAFLFSLVNPAGAEPTKININAGNQGNAILCNSGYGPTFGNGHDLHIANNPNGSNTCYVGLGNSYNCPPGQSSTNFLTGGQSFTVSELEVFEHIIDN